MDVRVIASTRHNLADLAESRRFREDLFYRLNVLTLRIPPLRERPSDVQPLLELFITKHCNKLGMLKPKLTDDLLDKLSQYQWPGNMRQLDNMVLRALTEIEGDVLGIEPFHLPQVDSVSSAPSINLDGSLDDIMKEYESQVLDRLFNLFLPVVSWRKDSMFLTRRSRIS